MAILAECPLCHTKQAIKNRACSCGEDLVKAKRAQKVRYWISFRLPGGKQRREPVGFSVEEARDAEGKRRSQKRENRIFDMLPESKMSFAELTDWYLKLETVKATQYYDTLVINLRNFNADFGKMLISDLKPIHLENYQGKRKAARWGRLKQRKGYSDAYIDHELGAVRTMVNKAFDNDMVSGETVKVFRRMKRLLKANANARDRILSLDEFSKLTESLPVFTRVIFVTAFYSGMRRGEIFSLTWDKVDLKGKFIRLEACDTKDREPRSIPISPALHALLKSLPRGLHDPRVFPYSTEKALKEKLEGDIRRACSLAGIPYGRKVRGGFTFHDLRHTFNTYMRKAGVPQSVIMKITGHSTDQMFRRYNTIDSEDARDALTRYNAYLASVDQSVDQKSADSTAETK